MLVRFKQDWFGPDAVLRTRSAQPQYVSDEFRDVLPPSANIVDEHGHAVPKAEAPAQSLRDFDHERAAADAEEALRTKAEAFRAQAQAKRR